MEKGKRGKQSFHVLLLFYSQHVRAKKKGRKTRERKKKGNNIYFSLFSRESFVRCARKKKRFLPSSAPFLLAFVPQQFASAAGMLALSSLHLTFMLTAAQRMPQFQRVSDRIVEPTRHRHLKWPGCPSIPICERNFNAGRGPCVTDDFHNEV